MAATPRLVLDTNIWLDWLVFHDAEAAPLKAAVARGQAEIFIDAACEEELARVLAYPLRNEVLAADARAALLATCRRLARLLEPGMYDDAGAGAVSQSRLPACRDAHDQKFLELARDCRADFLVTRDRQLLHLARRRLRPAPFRIVTPAEMNAALAAAAAAP